MQMAINPPTLPPMTKPLVILCAGGHGGVVLDAARVGGRRVAGFLDSASPAGHALHGADVLGGDALLDDAIFVAGHDFVVATGIQGLRRRLSLLVRSRGGRLATIIHPSAIVSPAARIGAGTVLAAGAIINPGSRVGDFVIVNTGATIDHDNLLEDGVQICPGAHLAGHVTCREDAFVGTGAAVIPKITIGARAIVGAGTTVIEDVPEGETVVGCPARAVRP
ncbi:MAG: acetyltransferase [Alphaproteobacteria bacterium]|nr:acetyltransferase [Alphaproteobacteria bacterium]